MATLEAIVCREALSLVEDLHIHESIIASDSKQVINDLNNNHRGKHGAIIFEINHRASVFNCKFTLEGRASNGDAHSIARSSLCLQQGRHLWLVYPHANCIPQTVAFDQ